MKNMNMYLQKSRLNRLSIVHRGKTLTIIMNTILLYLMTKMVSFCFNFSPFITIFFYSHGDESTTFGELLPNINRFGSKMVEFLKCKWNSSTKMVDGRTAELSSQYDILCSCAPLYTGRPI